MSKDSIFQLKRFLLTLIIIIVSLPVYWIIIYYLFDIFEYFAFAITKFWKGSVAFIVMYLSIITGAIFYNYYKNPDFKLFNKVFLFKQLFPLTIYFGGMGGFISIMVCCTETFATIVIGLQAIAVAYVIYKKTK